MVFQALNSVFEHVSAEILPGMPVDQVRLVSALLMVLPLGVIFSFLRGSFIRHSVGIALGLFLQYLVYADQIIHVLLQTAIVYAMLKFLKRKNVAVFVFVESLIFMSAHHIYRQYTSYGSWDMDITTVLMMTICKWTQFAWCYQDGGKAEEKLSEDQKLRQLKKLPSFMEYFSYIHFFGSAVCGPNFDYYEYDLFIHQKDTYAKIPFTLINSLTWLAKGASFAATTIFILPKYPLSYVLSKEYADSSFFSQFIFFNICITLMRFKYYAGWCFSQSGIAATGLSYNGKTEDGTNKWDRVVSCMPSNELSYDIRYKVECWNSSVQYWLKKYVYLRIYSEQEIKKSTKKANISQYATNIISAFWHGFYPGYYTAFLQWTLCMTCAKLFYNASITKAHVFNKIRKTVTTPVFVVGRFILAAAPLNCFGIGFQVLSLEANHIFFKTHGYLFLILVLLVIAAFTVTGWGQKKPKKHTDDKSTADTTSTPSSTEKVKTN